MPLFFYRARDNKNSPREGTIDVLSLQQARDLLKTKGLFVEEIHQTTLEEQGIEKAPYLPLIATLRLYAGWLLAWYGLIFAIGAYQHRAVLPFRSELIAGLASSTVVLVSAFGVFLFLMLSSLYKNIHVGLLKGIGLTFVWILGTIWFAVNI